MCSHYTRTWLKTYIYEWICRVCMRCPGYTEPLSVTNVELKVYENIKISIILVDNGVLSRHMRQRRQNLTSAANRGPHAEPLTARFHKTEVETSSCCH